ncbi:Translocation protein S62 [Coniosporium tulheliwenetii]|uniref:Translocation protein S62 n=1 Tax=Coniosporium tulheliwenetii TaxID=3383036 RepID=A0ACC2YND5_9PEZI|nr:Translocation protein S62 [Cladosporium sp. JES 115]
MNNPQMGPQPGQQPSPEQIRQMQAQLAAEAQRHGMSVQQYVEQLKAQAMRQHQVQQQQQQQQQQAAQQAAQEQNQTQQPIQPGPPKPEALAVANFLRSQDLKSRTCIFQEKRKDMFKEPLLPAVTDRPTAESTFKLLPLSLLALRVQKTDPHEGHDHAPAKKTKRTKGLWTVTIVQQQDIDDSYHYMWMYEPSDWKTKLYAVGALAAVFAVVLFPLWPLMLRQGVWYLSMGCLGLLGLFFAMAIFRLVLFCVTVFTTPPGLWLYPNLFEDVGFFDSFRPVWAWHEARRAAAGADGKPSKSKISKPVTATHTHAAPEHAGIPDNVGGSDAATAGSTTGARTVSGSGDGDGMVQRRGMQASVEEAEE